MDFTNAEWYNLKQSLPKSLPNEKKKESEEGQVHKADKRVNTDLEKKNDL